MPESLTPRTKDTEKAAYNAFNQAFVIDLVFVTSQQGWAVPENS
jgi:hypothetical protein